jgi:hypothetical protein
MKQCLAIRNDRLRFQLFKNRYNHLTSFDNEQLLQQTHNRYHQQLKFTITSENINQFNILYDSLDGGSARHNKVSTSTAQHRKTRKNTHALSRIRAHNPSTKAVKTHALNREVTVIGLINTSHQNTGCT